MILRDGRVVTSYSQIDKYIRCPQNWKLKYVDNIKVEKASKHMEYGLAVHETLEYLFKELRDNFKVPLELIEKIFKYNLSKRDIPYDSVEEELDWEMRGLIMLENLFEEGSELEMPMMNAKILGVELPFEVPIETAEREFINPKTEEVVKHDTVYIIGFIDLVLETDEGIIVIDHKSGGKKFDKAKLRSDLQFPIYALAIKELFGEYPIKSYYNFTKIHTHQILYFSEKITPEMEVKMNKRGCKEIYHVPPEDAEMQIKRIFADMYKPKQKAYPTPLCYWCDYGFYSTGICKKSHKYQPK